MTRYTATIELKLTRTDNDLRPMQWEEAAAVAKRAANQPVIKQEDVVRATIQSIERVPSSEVEFEECPCKTCGGRGWVQASQSKHDCERCDGTGVIELRVTDDE